MRITNSGVCDLIVVYISIFEECLVVVLSGWQSNWFCCFLCEIVKKSEGVGRKGLNIPVKENEASLSKFF